MRNACRRSTRSAPGSTTRDGPRRPSGCQREHGSGSGLPSSDELVVVARARRRRSPRRCRSRRARARGRRPPTRSRTSVRLGRPDAELGPAVRAAGTRRAGAGTGTPSLKRSEPIRLAQQVDEAGRRRPRRRRARSARTVRAPQLVDDGAAAGRALGDVELDVELGKVMQDLGVDHVGDSEGIVHWGVVMPIDLQVKPPVEGVKVGDHRAGVTAPHATPRPARR